MSKLTCKLCRLSSILVYVLQPLIVLVNPNWTLLVENFQTLQVTERH